MWIEYNGKLTFIYDLPSNIDHITLVHDLKKLVKCNGCISDIENNKIIQLKGDRRDAILKYLNQKEIGSCHKNNNEPRHEPRPDVSKSISI